MRAEEAGAVPMTPNLFLLGAAKCGTSSLYNILGQHPDVHASAVKEPTFFCSQFRMVHDPVRYFRLMDSPRRWRVDGSGAYLTNPETPPILKALFPEARFIVSVRDPKRRAHSFYRHMRRARHRDGEPMEDIPDFLEALKAEPDRLADPNFPRKCRQYVWNFMYCGSSLYDEHIARYLDLFDRAQIHVLSLAELAADPVGATLRIAQFLDIDPGPVAGFNFDPVLVGGPCDPCGAECDRIMDEAFAGLADRVDRLVGRPLDWSL